MKLRRHKSAGPDNTHPRAPGELPDAAAKPLSLIFEKSWWSSEVPRGRKMETSLLFLKRDKRKNQGTIDQ